MAHSGACGRDRAQSGITRRSSIPLANREDRQHAVADELQHLATEGMDGAGDTVEPGVERGDHILRIACLGQFGKAAQVGKQQCCPDGFAGFAPQPPGQNLCRAAPAGDRR